MAYELILAPGAQAQYKALSAFVRAQIRDAMEQHLRHEPAKVSRSRIKRLQGLARPQYRLRVGEFRVYYDITSTAVQILAIVPKSEAERWLSEAGEPT